MRKTIQVDKQAHDLLAYMASRADSSINEIVIMLTLNYAYEFMHKHTTSDEMAALIKELAVHYTDKRFHVRKGDR